MSRCKNCRFPLDGDYDHWPVGGFLYCDVCFEMLLVIASHHELLMAHRNHLAGIAE